MVAGEGEDLHDLREDDAGVVAQELGLRRVEGGDQLAVVLEVSLTHSDVEAVGVRHNGSSLTHVVDVGDEPGGEPGLDIGLKAGEVHRAEEGEDVHAVHLVLVGEDDTEDVSGDGDTLPTEVGGDTDSLLGCGIDVAQDNLPLTSRLLVGQWGVVESGEDLGFGLRLHREPLVEAPDLVVELVEGEVVSVHPAALDDVGPVDVVKPDADVAGGEVFLVDKVAPGKGSPVDHLSTDSLEDILELAKVNLALYGKVGGVQQYLGHGDVEPKLRRNKVADKAGTLASENGSVGSKEVHD